jgi:transposase
MRRRNEYTREEKIAAVKLVTEDGRTTISVAKEYGIHENTLYKWKREYTDNPKAAFTEEPVGDSAELEIERLKRRNRELEAEVDFLKKVSAYFAKGPK